jgi:hypothetical protein
LLFENITGELKGNFWRTRKVSVNLSEGPTFETTSNCCRYTYRLFLADKEKMAERVPCRPASRLRKRQIMSLLTKRTLIASIVFGLSATVFAEEDLEKLKAEIAELTPVVEKLNAQVEELPYNKCLTKFNASAQFCGSGGCSQDKQGRTLKQVCGPIPKIFLERLDKYNEALQDLWDNKSDLEFRIKEAIVLRIGSPESDVIAKLGKPQKVNRTVSASGVKKQMVYEWRGVTFYTENGVVTGWQD